MTGPLRDLSQIPLEGYEIHMGVTTYTKDPCPLVQIQEETGKSEAGMMAREAAVVMAVMYMGFLSIQRRSLVLLLRCKKRKAMRQEILSFWTGKHTKKHSMKN